MAMAPGWIFSASNRIIEAGREAGKRAARFK
jgi:hypothetical protein